MAPPPKYSSPPVPQNPVINPQIQVSFSQNLGPLAEENAYLKEKNQELTANLRVLSDMKEKLMDGSSFFFSLYSLRTQSKNHSSQSSRKHSQ